jgi:ribose 5-phosphate isomerase A
MTDEGNIILDCHFPGLPNPLEIAQLIRAQPGVVEHGLFLGMATEAIVAGKRGVVVLER